MSFLKNNKLPLIDYPLLCKALSEAHLMHGGAAYVQVLVNTVAKMKTFNPFQNCLALAHILPSKTNN